MSLLGDIQQFLLAKPSLKLQKQISDLQEHGTERGTLASAAVLEDRLVLGTPEKTPPIKAL